MTELIHICMIYMESRRHRDLELKYKSSADSDNLSKRFFETQYHFVKMNRLKGSQDMSGCFLYMNCGNDGRASPNFRTFDSACTAAAYACESDYACARDYIVRSM